MATCTNCEADLFDGSGRCPFCGHFSHEMKHPDAPAPSPADEGQGDSTPYVNEATTGTPVGVAPVAVADEPAEGTPEDEAEDAKGAEPEGSTEEASATPSAE